MPSLPMRTLQQLDTRLHEQILDVAHLRGALDLQMNRISQMYDHEGYAARVERYAIATAGTGIRGRSTVKTQPVPGTFRP
jgi:hypothetical protein